jgi:hypothetical protein
MSLQSCWRTEVLDWVVFGITPLAYHKQGVVEGSPIFNPYGTLVTQKPKSRNLVPA